MWQKNCRKYQKETREKESERVALPECFRPFLYPVFFIGLIVHHKTRNYPAILSCISLDFGLAHPFCHLPPKTKKPNHPPRTNHLHFFYLLCFNSPNLAILDQNTCRSFCKVSDRQRCYALEWKWKTCKGPFDFVAYVKRHDAVRCSILLKNLGSWSAYTLLVCLCW